MPNFASMDAFSRELGKMSAEVERKKRKDITGPMAEEAQKIAAKLLPADLGGDDSFSGWTSKNPISLDTVVRFTNTGAAIVHPTKVTAGPWTVLEQGRNKGNSGGFAGPAINKRTGLTSRTKSGGIRKQRSRRSRRWNGYTSGKGTASRAIAEMEKQLSKVAEDGVRKVVRRHFDVT